MNMTLALAEETTIVHKICPLPSELSCITKNIPCPEDGCSGTFLNSSNLEMHLSKHHKKRTGGNNRRDNTIRTNCQYHCPVEKCLYNINSDRYFSHIKYLKQHYLKVHAEKKFLCKKCDKGYSTEAACNVHMRVCGMKFTCSCGCIYLSYEALITHAKRKSHTFDANLKLCAKGQAPPKAPCSTTQESPPGGNALTLINDSKKSPYIIVNSAGSGLAGMPMNVKPLGTILPAISPSTSTGKDVGVQTERSFGLNGRRAGGRRSSAQTQTWSVKRPKICAGTQTQGDYILKRAMRAAQIPVSDSDGALPTAKGQPGANGEHSGARPAGLGGRKRKKSMETQTVVVEGTGTGTIPHTPLVGALESTGRHHRRPMKGVLTTEQNSDTLNSSNQNFDFAESSLEDSFSPPVTDPWIGIYTKCNSGTQTSPLPVKSVCNPVVTQTDLTGIFQENLNECHNHDSPYFCPLPDIKDNSADIAQDVPIGSHGSIPCLDDIANNIDVSVEDFSEQFDPMLLTPKLSTGVEDTTCPASSFVNGEVSLRGEVDLVGSIVTACSTETQTEGSSDPILSHIETQTNTEDFLSCSFEQLLHANMCTQTCEDTLFSELGFSDIQTQTQEEIRFWQDNNNPTCSDEIANPLSCHVSTETQTAISGGCIRFIFNQNSSEETQVRSWMSETSHMETQTDVDELRKLIAELTKHDIEGD